MNDNVWLVLYIKNELGLFDVSYDGVGTFRYCARSEDLIRILTSLHGDQRCSFEVLADVFAIDYPDREKRFEVTYLLLSITNNVRFIIKVQCGTGDVVPSATDVFKSAGWLEREVFDMFGITFHGHRDMRRILSDYGFKGHPLLKDFPLTGYKEVRYDIEKKKVVYVPVKLDQEYRHFDSLSPWLGDVQKNST